MPTINLTEEAYERLEALKRDDESVSDVVQRLAGVEQDKMNGFGSWEGEGLRGEISDYRDEFSRDLEEHVDGLSR